MSTYATKQKFGRKRAAVGDLVIIAVPKHEYARSVRGQGPVSILILSPPAKLEACLQAGVIVSVSKHEDRPHVRVLKTGETNYDNSEISWKFVNTLCEADVARLEIGEWTWPLELLDDQRG